MRTIIAGSRVFTDYKYLCNVMKSINIGWITVIISGGAKGIDSLGIRYAKENRLPCEIFLPEWDKFGKRAGIIRNCKMGDAADALIAIWDGKSRGTKHMIDYAMNSKRIKKIFVIKKIMEELNNADVCSTFG